ncbi:MAG: hypothetical protein ACR2PA_10445 [Hyphomicrobiaceae bacterium]
MMVTLMVQPIVLVNPLDRLQLQFKMHWRYPLAIPKLVPIAREEGYHTDQIGQFTEGQYLGFVFFLEPHQQRLVSVLHLFDMSGKHTSSNAWDSTDGVDPGAELANAISALPKPKPGDAMIAPFAVEFFGTTFGMIAVDDDRIDYQPYGLAFFPPWNGFCET